MKNNIVFSIAAVLFLSTFAAAQFPKIKIPTVKMPTVPKVDKAVPGIDKAVPGSVGTSAGKNRQNVIDDGFTFFEATPVTEYNEKSSGNISKGWTLTANLRAFGTFPDNSGFKVVVAQGGKAFATYMCQGKTHRKAESPVRDVKNSPDDDSMSTETGGTCGGSKDIFVKGPGKYDVNVFTTNGNDDSETAVRTYKIDVHEAKMIRPGKIVGPSDFYIQRYAESPVAILYLRPGLGSGRVKADYHEKGQGTTLKGNVDIYFSIAKNENSNGAGFAGVPYVRCSVNGQGVTFQNKGEVKDASMRGDKADYRRDGKPTEYIGFYSYWINLPINWRGNGTTGNPDMESQTGEWKCDLRDGSTTVRTFKWTVGGDGFPQQHPEQTSGNINLHWGAYLIDTAIPASGSSMDQRLMPMPDAGLFYGIPWKSAEGKKMAAGVPKVSDPYFMP